MSGNSDIASLLISHGAIATSDSFVLAAFRDDVERMIILHSAGVDINSTDSSGVPALIAAARNGQTSSLAWLISHGALVNQTDTYGISALSWAKASGNALAEEIIARAGGLEASPIPVLDEHYPDETLPEGSSSRNFSSEPISYRPGELIHKTLSGHLVRSKSEVIVADALHYRGIDFHYEKPFIGKNGRSFKLPDFTIKLRSGSVIIWEHLGMLDQESYKHAWDKKMLWYLLNGLEHSNLYISRESVASGINSHEVACVADAILKRYKE